MSGIARFRNRKLPRTAVVARTSVRQPCANAMTHYNEAARPAFPGTSRRPAWVAAVARTG